MCVRHAGMFQCCEVWIRKIDKYSVKNRMTSPFTSLYLVHGLAGISVSVLLSVSGGGTRVIHAPKLRQHTSKYVSL